MSTFPSFQNSSSLTRRLRSRLRKLVAINTETGNRFKSLVEQFHDPHLAYEFREWSLDRRANATELREMSGSEDPPAPPTQEKDSWLSRLQQRLAKTRRRSLSSDAQMALLEETDAIENQVKREYEETLRMSRGTPLLRILQSQYLGVKAVQDKTRRFLEQLRNST